MGVKIKSITIDGEEDVYNLEVEKYHNFSVNGGLIIHNCDALRYSIYSNNGGGEVSSGKSVRPTANYRNKKY